MNKVNAEIVSDLFIYEIICNKKAKWKTKRNERIEFFRWNYPSWFVLTFKLDLLCNACVHSKFFVPGKSLPQDWSDSIRMTITIERAVLGCANCDRRDMWRFLHWSRRVDVAVANQSTQAPISLGEWSRRNRESGRWNDLRKKERKKNRVRWQATRRHCNYMQRLTRQMLRK